MAGESLIIGNGNWGVKSGNLLGYNLINSKYVPRELAFARATTGTRTNASGLIETIPYNLVTYSEQFDNADWSKSRTVVVPNAIASPTGLITADIVQSTDNTNVQSIYQLYTGAISENFSLSFYVKKKEVNIIQIEFFPSPYSVEYGVNIDLTTNAYVNWPNGVDSCIVENIGTDGWKRITITKNIPATTAMYVQLFLASTLNGVPREICTLPVGSGIYLWGAQLVVGPSAKTYLPTTTRLNIPRIDYSTGTAALLMEPQRTNLSNWSENMANGWNVSVATLTENSAISPSGLLNASKITVTSPTNGYIYRTVATVVSTVYTFSVYIKSATGSNVSGAIHADNITNSQSFTATNTWQRVSVTFTASATVSSFYIGGFGSLSLGEDLYVWGAQIEAGTYATSYIPTTSATVTRNEDVSNTSGMANFIGQTEGTIFWDGIARYSTPTFYNIFSIIKDAGLSKYIYLGILDTGYITIVTPTISYETSSLVVPANTRFKLALRYKTGDWVMYLNGVQVWSKNAAVSAGTYDIIQQTYGGNYFQTNQVYSHILYPTGLSNAELADLTIGTIDPDAAAFFSRVTAAGGTLSGTEQTAINALVVQMKAVGIWTSMKAIYPMVGGSAAACAQNLKSSSFTGTFSSGWTFTSTGAKPNGTSAFMNTNLQISTNLALSSSHITFYSRTNISESSYDFTADQFGMYLFNSAFYVNLNNQSIYTSVALPNTRGFFLANRISLTNVNGFLNSSKVINVAQVSELNATNLTIASRTGSSLFSSKECAFASIGDGLTDTQASDFYTAVQAFQTTLGRQV